MEGEREREGSERDNLGVAVCSYRYSQLISTYNFNLRVIENGSDTKCFLKVIYF